MEHRTLADKLDAIDRSELGIPFDDNLIWDDISAGLLQTQKRTIFGKRFLLVACLTLLILSIPIQTLRNEELVKMQVVGTADNVELSESQTTVAEEHRNEPGKILRKFPAPMELTSKGIDLSPANPLLFENPVLMPIEMPHLVTRDVNHFTSSDLSAIQATLQKSEEKNGLKFSVKMELYTSSSSPQYSESELKLRINGRN